MKEVTITLLNRIPGAEKLGLVSNMSNLSYYTGYLGKEFQYADGNKDLELKQITIYKQKKLSTCSRQVKPRKSMIFHFLYEKHAEQKEKEAQGKTLGNTKI